MEQRIILEIPKERAGVYAILNPITKRVYVGETEDYNYRMVSHIRAIFGKGFSGNKNLRAENCKAFDAFEVISSVYEKKKASH